MSCQQSRLVGEEIDAIKDRGIMNTCVSLKFLCILLQLYNSLVYMTNNKPNKQNILHSDHTNPGYVQLLSVRLTVRLVLIFMMVTICKRPASTLMGCS